MPLEVDFTGAERLTMMTAAMEGWRKRAEIAEARIAALEAVARSAVQVAGWQAIVDAATNNPTTERDMMEAHLSSLAASFEGLVLAVRGLPHEIRDEWVTRATLEG